MSVIILLQGGGAAPQSHTLNADAGSVAFVGIAADLEAIGILSASMGSWAVVGVGADLVLQSAFPTQYPGLRFYDGAVRELCLVAVADAPGNMGGVLKMRKGGTDYAVYIVETNDSNASRARIQTVTGVKALRLKT